MISAINAAATDVQSSEQTSELTADELDHVAGGTPSIPIPPPTPHSYAIGRIEARFPGTT